MSLQQKSQPKTTKKKNATKRGSPEKNKLVYFISLEKLMELVKRVITLYLKLAAPKQRGETVGKRQK